MMKKLLLLLSLLLLFVSCSKKDTNTLVVYTALEDDQIPTYLESFKQAHPEINLEIVRNSTGIITAKLLAEKDNPKADLVWGTAATSLMVMKQAGMLEPYAPKGIEHVEDKFIDKDEVPSWVGIDAFMTGIVVNPIELKAKNLPMPHSFEDLLDPVYRGHLVMPNPASSGTGFLTVSGILQLMGEEKGWDYLNQLHKNMARYTHSGSKPAKLAGAGEYPIGISFGYRGVMQKRLGQPVVTIFPAEGSGWDMEANALIKKESIKPEAKKFLDWAISKDVMKKVAKNFAVVTVDVGNAVPEGFPADPLAQLIDNDFAWSAKNRTTILEEWSRRYDGKSDPQ